MNEIIKGKPSAKILARKKISEVMLNISDLNAIKSRIILGTGNQITFANTTLHGQLICF